ncbi:uncharacterized protein LOC127850891 [Dreissena polymorpha]|uniref:Uncharacterized protein n=1 Tax=Dreissena polymorpha TaxID=45954 RepID=A0A9D4DAC0_DREPO|nr:uncharacterized protein LOC127850891 [Dreissena polymorpha]KAH3741057.1 hypothetical protein DPMN_047775 [Dreissena polymorpha]
MPTSVHVKEPIGYGTNKTLMRSQTNGPTLVSMHQSGLFSVGTHDPSREKLSDGHDIIPYATKQNSPVRVTFTPGTLSKDKSRIADQSKSAIFNYKPLRRADSKNLLSRFRPPDATLTTLQNLSPWLSVSKSDFRDPRLNSELAYDGHFDKESLEILKPRLFRRSFTEGQIDLSKVFIDEASATNTYQAESLARRAGFDPRCIPTYKPQSRELSITKRDTITSQKDSRRSVSALSDRADQIEVGVTYESIDAVKVDDQRREAEERHINQTHPATDSPTRMVDANRSFKKKLVNKTPERLVNYYSGYLPPELSSEIAEQWERSANSRSMSKTPDPYAVSPNSHMNKPLIGDRSFYMRNAFPVTRKYCRSDIDAMRLEGRKKLLQSYGHVPAHYSVLNEGKKGIALDEAIREKQSRLSASFRRSKSFVSQPKGIDLAKEQKPSDPSTDTQKVTETVNKAPLKKLMDPLPNSNPKQGLSSIEKFQIQRERTYQLQSQAREMLSK